jgi:hypothetical protein
MSQSSTESNRRRIRRRTSKRMVKVRCQKGGWGLGTDMARTLLDVSTEGARLVVAGPLDNGQEITLSLEGPWHVRPLTLCAHVRWCTALADGTHCIGVRFEKMLPYSEVQDLASARDG